MSMDYVVISYYSIMLMYNLHLLCVLHIFLKYVHIYYKHTCINLQIYNFYLLLNTNHEQ